MFRDLFKPKSWLRRNTDGEPEADIEHAPVGPFDESASEQSETAINAYSRRMMPPFSGNLQIVECGDARALSMDGENWEIQYRFATGERPGSIDPQPRRDKYTVIASITPAGHERLSLPPVFDTEVVARRIEQLFAWIPDSSLPYPATDRFEYWLLDLAEQKPLALLKTCASLEEMGPPMVRPVWTAMPASQMPIDEAAEEGTEYVPPVNARLETLVAQRAGPSPQAAWFDRGEETDTEFPTYFIREDWDEEQHGRLCRLYIRRLAPRLLMLQGLSQENRRQLEQAARENALEVDRFHRLYPEVIDQKMINALCVEARIRRSSAT